MNTHNKIQPNIFPPLGFVFRPTIQEIFTEFLPRRLIFGRDALLPYKGFVSEIDLYENKSPDEIFEHSNQDEFYLFTSLDNHCDSGKRIKREVAGKGNWSCKSRRDDCMLPINGKEIRVGSKRQFKFQDYTCKDNTISWIMHEYLPDKDYINDVALAKKCKNINNEKLSIAFCYVYKKVESVKYFNHNRKGDCLLVEGAKKMLDHVQVNVVNNDENDLATKTLLDLTDFDDKSWEDVYNDVLSKKTRNNSSDDVKSVSSSNKYEEEVISTTDIPRFPTIDTDGFEDLLSLMEFDYNNISKDNALVVI